MKESGKRPVEEIRQELKRLALNSEPNRDTAREVWRVYIELNLSSGDRSSLNLIRNAQLKTIEEILKGEGTFEHNSTTATAIGLVRNDFGLFSSPGLFGELDESQREKLSVMVTEMSDALIRN